MKNVFIFLAGALVGSVVTAKILDKKYAEIADKEIESVKEVYKEKMMREMQNNIKERELREDKFHINSTEDAKKIIKEDYKGKVDNLGYGVDLAKEDSEDVQIDEEREPLPDEIEDEEDPDSLVDAENGPDHVVPYIISENEFGEFGNDEKTLFYYEDGVLADEDDDIITDPEEVIGDALSEFDNDEEFVERIFVRDEEKEIDYTILRSEKTYKEVCGEEE